MKPVILASSSPQRKDLLEKAGLVFIVDPVEVDEAFVGVGKSIELAVSISLAKATRAAMQHPCSIIIAADTFGLLDGRLLGKPANADDAREMLLFMNGKCHKVITGFTIMDSDTGETVSAAVETNVYFKKLNKSIIENYVRTGEPLNKAGAYAIQGLGASLVDRIEGDYYNVIGLPVCALARELKKFKIDLPGISYFDCEADSPAR